MSPCWIALAALIVTACSDDDASSAPSERATSPAVTVTPAITLDPTLAAEAEYDAVLAQIGVELVGAHAGALDLDGATFCGWDSSGPHRAGQRRAYDGAARQCFLDAHMDGRPAVFVEDAHDNHGTSVPTILRTETGRVTWYGDLTEDNLGTQAWQQGTCDNFYISSLDTVSPRRIVFSCNPPG